MEYDMLWVRRASVKLSKQLETVRSAAVMQLKSSGGPKLHCNKKAVLKAAGISNTARGRADHRPSSAMILDTQRFRIERSGWSVGGSVIP